MGEPHVMSALKARKADLERAIEHGRKALAQWERDLAAVEASLAVMAGKRPARLALYVVPDQFKRLRTTRLVLAIVRQSAEPLTVRQIAEAIIRQHGGDEADSRLRRMIERRVWVAVTKAGVNVAQGYNEP